MVHTLSAYVLSHAQTKKGAAMSDSDDSDSAALRRARAEGYGDGKTEGRLELIVDRASRALERISVVEAVVHTLESLTQTLKEGAVASEKTAVALASALEKASETAEANARKERETAADKQDVVSHAQFEATQQAAVKFTPWQRIAAIAVVVIPLMTGAYALLHK